MKWKSIVAVLLCAAVLPASAWAAKGSAPKALDERVSYTIGFNIGASLQQDHIPVDAGVLLGAIGDVLADTKPKLSHEQMQQAMEGLQQVMMSGGEPSAAQKHDISYTLGMNYGVALKRDRVPVNRGSLEQGLNDGLSGNEGIMSEEDMKTAMRELQDQMHEVMMKRAEENRQRGEAYLAENRKKKGVTSTASGLQYRVIQAGKGEKPTADSEVTVHYRGTLIDGTEFDSSYSRGEPATFPVGRVIQGWQEALQLMPEGSKWEVVIPSDLAYGPTGAGGDIGPNETLIFEIELLKVAAAPAMPAGHP